MPDIPKSFMTRAEVLKGAAIGGIINAVINGTIQARQLAGSGPIPLSVDSIAAGTDTVLAAAVPLAVSVAMMLTGVAYATIKVPRKPFVPTGLWLLVKHGIFAFGAVVTLAVLWQAVAGTVEVSKATAVVLLGLIAGTVAVVVNYMSITALVEDIR
jgi:hypothetical protein